MPGVTVTAVHEASGITFEAVTDERGVFRMPARIGTYRITAVLAGFAEVNRTGLPVAVGQTVTINLQLAPSTVQETVTVSAGGAAKIQQLSGARVATLEEDWQLIERAATTPGGATRRRRSRPNATW